MADLVKTFGPEVDDLQPTISPTDDPAFQPRPVQNPAQSAAYYAATPGPNSFEIQPTFRDADGRAYAVATKVIPLDTDVDNDNYTGPRGTYRRLLLWVAMPRGETEAELPAGDGDTLRIQHMETQMWYEMETDGSYFYGKNKSGHIYVVGWRQAAA